MSTTDCNARRGRKYFALFRRLSLEERFDFELSIAERVGECLITDCQESTDGYPKLTKMGKSYRLHRLVLEHKLGRKLAPDEVARHTCHVRMCIEPEHLVPGTPADNTADAARAGRMCRGERHWQAKLNPDSVRHIRMLHAAGETFGSIARGYGLSHLTITAVIKRKTWKHLP